VGQVATERGQKGGAAVWGWHMDMQISLSILNMYKQQKFLLSTYTMHDKI
jgi:hypothetical protein